MKNCQLSFEGRTGPRSSPSTLSGVPISEEFDIDNDHDNDIELAA